MKQEEKMTEDTWKPLGEVAAKIVNKLNRPKYWVSPVGEFDDFGNRISTEFIDGKTVMGPWAMMTPTSWRLNGIGKLGTGYGQRYRKQPDGKWLKVEG
jgi:hypothetical protein